VRHASRSVEVEGPAPSRCEGDESSERRAGAGLRPARTFQYRRSVVMAGVRRNMARPKGIRIRVAHRA
jgi:hypothetical protein